VRKILLLVTFVGAMVLLFALGVGVASADHSGGTEWTCDEAQNGGGCAPGSRNPIGPAAEHALAPVGRNISEQGFVNGFDGNPNSNAFNAIANNPLCPFHPVEVETP
jgi:hypothetical protein